MAEKKIKIKKIIELRPFPVHSSPSRKDQVHPQEYLPFPELTPNAEQSNACKATAKQLIFFFYVWKIFQHIIFLIKDLEEKVYSENSI